MLYALHLAFDILGATAIALNVGLAVGYFYTPRAWSVFTTRREPRNLAS